MNEFDKTPIITGGNLVFGDCTFEVTTKSGDKITGSGPMSDGEIKAKGNLVINGTEMSQKEAETYLESIGIGKAST